jgi:hypothetical protein
MSSDVAVEQIDLEAAYAFTRTGGIKGSDYIGPLAELFARHRQHRPEVSGGEVERCNAVIAKLLTMYSQPVNPDGPEAVALITHLQAELARVREDERGQIVEWLRGQGQASYEGHFGKMFSRPALNIAAEAIERLDHHKGTEG